MAAITGASTGVHPVPARRKVGGLVRFLPEFSAQTHPVGAMLARSAGSYISAASAEAQSTGILGFAISKGDNLTTTTASGQSGNAYYAMEKGQAYELAFQATWTASAHRNLTAALYMDASGNVWVSSGGASTCGTIINAKDWDNGVAVLDGDVNPVVYFVFADAAISLS